MSFDADLITTAPVAELAPPAPRSARQVERDAAIDALHQATAFYTADPIVDQLLDWLDFPRGSRRLVDSSCGDGAFLGRALERLLRHEPEASDERLLDLVHGWEIHRIARGAPSISVGRASDLEAKLSELAGGG
jgi:hypothetical protein